MVYCNVGWSMVQLSVWHPSSVKWGVEYVRVANKFFQFLKTFQWGNSIYLKAQTQTSSSYKCKFFISINLTLHWHWYLHCTISPNNTNIFLFLEPLLPNNFWPHFNNKHQKHIGCSYTQKDWRWRCRRDWSGFLFKVFTSQT